MSRTIYCINTTIHYSQFNKNKKYINTQFYDKIYYDFDYVRTFINCSLTLLSRFSLFLQKKKYVV